MSMIIQTSVRLQPKLHQELRKAAFKKSISLNQEIVMRLEAYNDLVKKIDATIKKYDGPGQVIS